MATSVNTRVGDIMTKDPVCIDAASSVREVATLLDENEISGAPVVSADGHLIGVVSRTDLLRHGVSELADGGPSFLLDLAYDDSDDRMMSPSRSDVQVEEFMSTEPVTATPDDSAGSVAKAMVKNRVHRVIVVDNRNFPIGIVTSLDVLALFGS